VVIPPASVPVEVQTAFIFSADKTDKKKVFAMTNGVTVLSTWKAKSVL
jgi:hypothetical protein